MTTVSLISFSGAPGVTTVALATAAALTGAEVPEPVLVELATSGGVVGGWYDLPSEPGLSSLALTVGTDETPDLLGHAQALPGGLPVVVAPPSGSRVATLVAARGRALATYLQAVRATVVADCGRISVDTPVRPVLETSTLIGVVVRPTREDFRLAATALAELNTVASGPLPAGWILVGDSPWSVEEIGAQYGLPVLVTVPDDAPGADAVAGRRRQRRVAPLARSVRSFADDIAKHLRVAPVDNPLGYLSDDGQPVEPARPAESDPLDEAGTDEVITAEPDEAAEAARSAQPAEPAQPAESVQPAESAQPAESVRPSGTDEATPVEPSEVAPVERAAAGTGGGDET